MKALHYPRFDCVEINEFPVPSPAPHEVLLRVAACGLCASELETFHNRSPRRQPPLIMGHEFCGTVVDVGREVSRQFIGQLFVSNSVVPCGKCARCRRGDTHLCAHRQLFGMHRAGAFTEYVSVPESVLIPWPKDVPPKAACLAEPLANGVHVVNLTRHVSARTALIIGAGPIGLMCQQALQVMRGIEVMACDLSASRLEIAARLGAAKTVSSKDQDVTANVLAWTDGEGVDLVIDAAGTAATKRLSLAALRPGGAAVWIGLHTDRLELDSYEITLAEKQVLGTYSARKEELIQALSLMSERKVDVTSWTNTVPLEASVEAFYRMLKPGDNDLKTIFVPQTSTPYSPR
jgi:threonine dehydrogenase-like Zn-dependent dehydrogenase